MLPHQHRVITEHAELITKIESLKTFIEKTALFLELDNVNKALLIKQLRHMSKYANTLYKRILLFTV